MDRLKDIYAQHRDALDTLEPTPAMWDHVSARLANHNVHDRSPRTRRTAWRELLGLAAMLLVVIGLAWVVLKERTPKSEFTALENGSIFPEVNLRDPQGNLVPLSSLKGKVVLVEFWASYSTVCTETNCYHFAPVYEQYKDKGFEIYAISLDSSAQHWLHGIERDQLPWINVADLSGALPPPFPSTPSEDLPLTYLLDPQGKILAQDIDAHELEPLLKSMLANGG
jgi:peroxiredoxin